MTIATFADLQTTLTSWLGHSLNSANYGDGAALFEAHVNRRLRCREMESTVSITPSGSVVALPADFLLQRRLTFLGSTQVELEYVQPSYLHARYPSAPTGTPVLYTVEGANAFVQPSNSSPVQLDYYAKLTTITGTSTASNWLLTSHPDVYLFGTLCEMEMFGVNDERAPLWKARRDEVLEEIQNQSKKTRGVGGMRIMSATP